LPMMISNCSFIEEASQGKSIEVPLAEE
jgi:hypothetical protein